MLRNKYKRMLCLLMILCLMFSMFTNIFGTYLPNGAETNTLSFSTGISVKEGIYLLCLFDSNLYMESTDEVSVVLGNNTELYTSKWEIKHVGNNYYKIRNVHYNVYLTASTTEVNEYYRVSCETEYTSTNIDYDKQLWKFTNNCSFMDSIQIVSKYNENTALALGSSDDMGSYGYYLVQREYYDDFDNSDEWEMILVEEKAHFDENATYYFTNPKTADTLMYDEVNVFGNSFGVSEAYEWKFIYDSSTGYYKIRNVQSNKYLTSSDFSNIGASPTLQLETAALADRQLWKLFMFSNGQYKLQAKVLERVNMITAMRTSGGCYLTNTTYIEDNNYADLWTIYKKGTDVLTLSLYDSLHNHSKGIFKSIPSIIKKGYDGFNICIDCFENGMPVSGDSLTTATIKNNIPYSKVFITRSHGDYDAYGTYLKSTILAKRILSPEDIYDFFSYTVVTDMSNCDIAMFVGCYTGINLAEGLLGASIEAGARCAIGFKDTISCEPSNDLMWNFWNRYNEFPDYNIQNIIDMAINDCGDYYDRSGNLVETNLDSYVILVREENGEILAYERE